MTVVERLWRVTDAQDTPYLKLRFCFFVHVSDCFFGIATGVFEVCEMEEWKSRGERVVDEREVSGIENILKA